MDRREFLKLVALLSANSVFCSCNSCTSSTPRYVRPAKLTQPGEKLLLTNATIIDVLNGTVKEKYQILVQGGKILDLLPWNDEALISADRELNVGGAYVTPGLINAHCHMTIPCSVVTGLDYFMSWRRQVERNAEECIKHGVTTVRDMLAFPGLLCGLKEKIAKEEIAGPRIISSYALDVKGGYGDNMPFIQSQQVRNPEEGPEGVRTAIDKGADLIKIFQQPVSLVLPEKELQLMDVATIRAICEEAERRGKIVAMHHWEIAGFDKGLAGGVSSFEHMATDGHLTEERIKGFLDSGAYIVPTVTVGLALAYETHGDSSWGKGLLAKLVEERSRLFPGMAHEYLETDIAEGLLKAFENYSDPDYFESRHLLPTVNAPWFAGRVGPYVDNIKGLYEAGVPMGCGNDGGIYFVFPGAMGLEMYLLEVIGIKPADSLRMATVENARLLGMENELGTIEEGKTADLAVFEKNPLETARNMFNPILVFRGGRLVYRA